SLRRVLHNLAVAITNRLNLPRDKVIPPPEEELGNNPDLFASSFLPQVYQALNGRNLVLLLDEFDVLSNYSGEAAVEHFFPYLEAILPGQQHLFMIAVVGRRLKEIPTLLSLFKGAPNHEIGLLDRTSAQQLITEPARGILQYEDDAIDGIFTLAAGHPY